MNSPTTIETPTINNHQGKDTNALCNAINLIDCLSQSGFSEISAIARLTLLALEHPDSYNHIENIAQALRAIRHRADDIQSCINCEAENVGCNYRDDAPMHRYAAQRGERAELRPAYITPSLQRLSRENRASFPAGAAITMIKS